MTNENGAGPKRRLALACAALLAAGSLVACRGAAELGGHAGHGGNTGGTGGGASGAGGGGQDAGGDASIGPDLSSGPDLGAGRDVSAGGDLGTGGTAGQDGGADAVGGMNASVDGGSPGGTDTAAAEDGGTSPCAGLLCDTTIAFPQSIKDTGVFLAPPDFSRRPERIKLYAPSPELWSDGLHKQRYILLPPGTKVDSSKPEKWVFPTGTVFIKTFLDDGPGGARHPVETRFIRRRATGYDFAVYRWNPAGTEATLVDNADDLRVPVEATLAGNRFTHQIPSQKDCRACHLANQRIGIDDPPRTAFIGFDEVRLNSKLDPAAAGVQLNDLHASGYLTTLPASPATITDANPSLLRVKRFVFGNCAHCHHGDGPFDLRPGVFVDNTVNKQTQSSGVTPPPGFLRIVPRDPEKSVLFLQLRATNLPPTLKPMPPVGVQFPPVEEIANLQSWINSLP